MQRRVQELVQGELDERQRHERRQRGSVWCQKAWARLVRVIVRMIITARDQMVVDALTVQPAPSSTASSSTAPQPKRRHERQQRPLRQGLGPQMSRSQTQKVWPKEPEDCEHIQDQLRMRGNQAMHWWVCLNCGSRWERIEAATVNPGRGALPEHVKPVYRTTEPPRMLPPPRTGPHLGSITLEQARTKPSRSSTSVRFGESTTAPTMVGYQKGTIVDKKNRVSERTERHYPDEMFTHEPEYAKERTNVGDSRGSVSNSQALTLFRPGAPARDVDRVDARRMMQNRPSEWADYDTEERTAGPMEEANAHTPRRSRSLPAGVHPIQDRSRRRQVQEQSDHPELFAIHDSDPELGADKTPSSFSMVDQVEQDEL